MSSIWQGEKKPDFLRKNEEIRTDVLIIGGGICGILCAHMLSSKGIDCIVAEADEICSQTTSCTTAKITSQHGLIYSKLARSRGYEMAELYFRANENALQKYRDLCQKTDCDYEELDSFVYSQNDKDALEKELRTLERIGARASLVEKTPLPLPIVGAVKLEGQAQFHPLKFAFSLSRSLNILEHTRVIEIRKDRAITNQGTIRAKSFIVATHFPFMNKYGGYFLKLYQHRSYVLALKDASLVNGIYVDEDKKGLSFRNYGDLLLLGGGGHRTGKHGGAWAELRGFASKYYPSSEEVAKWATQDCMSLDGVPYIGKYSSGLSNVFVATGFNKWGFSSSMVSASLLTDLILGKKSEYEALFSPQRSVLKPQLAINSAEAIINLITPTVPRCPHMGCALKYNKQEHSWDCSCHGSRFDKKGRLLNNPATGDMKKSPPCP